MAAATACPAQRSSETTGALWGSFGSFGPWQQFASPQRGHVGELPEQLEMLAYGLLWGTSSFAQGVTEGGHSTLANVFRIKPSCYELNTARCQAQGNVHLVENKYHHHAVIVDWTFGRQQLEDHILLCCFIPWVMTFVQLQYGLTVRRWSVIPVTSTQEKAVDSKIQQTSAIKIKHSPGPMPSTVVAYRRSRERYTTPSRMKLHGILLQRSYHKPSTDRSSTE